MNNKVSFTIPGKVRGKGRHRHTKTGITYTPKATKEYEELVRMYFYSGKNKSFENGVALSAFITVYVKPPVRAKKIVKEAMLKNEIKPIMKPDNDNIEKIIFDALNKVAYYDDTQIVENTTIKKYSEEEKVEVTIMPCKKCERMY